MSLTMSMIPAALTLRAVMGEKNFNKWLDSMMIRYPAGFRNEQEIARITRKAGFHVEKKDGVLQASSESMGVMFSWDWFDGKWWIVFNTTVPRATIDRVMTAINQAAERNVFGGTGTVARMPVEKAGKDGQPPSVFPTNFRDGEVLFRTLTELGAHPARDGDAIECRVENTRMIFRQTLEGSPFQVEIHNPPDLLSVFRYLSDLDSDYKRCVQTIVYEKLKERAARRNMAIESEEVLADNSIVLTLNVRG